MEFVVLCYHYIRPERTSDPFPRIWGNTEAAFRQHIETLKAIYEPISLEEVDRFYTEGIVPDHLNGKRALLFTFDDGLADHLKAAEILHTHGIKGTFFIPTCIYSAEPANPQVIHYMLERYGIDGFIESYRTAAAKHKVAHELYFTKGIDKPTKKIGEIKELFKYKLPYETGRKMLLEIFETFKREFPNAMEIIHLTREQTKAMKDMGHSVGVHSHTHLSVAASNVTPEDAVRELIRPKKILEETTGAPVFAFSYPFGGKKDCLSAETFISTANEYRLAFTVEKISNTKDSNKYELGRLMPISTDTADDLVTGLASLHPSGSRA